MCSASLCRSRGYLAEFARLLISRPLEWTMIAMPKRRHFSRQTFCRSVSNSLRCRLSNKRRLHHSGRPRKIFDRGEEQDFFSSALRHYFSRNLKFRMCFLSDKWRPLSRKPILCVCWFRLRLSGSSCSKYRSRLSRFN